MEASIIKPAYLHTGTRDKVATLANSLQEIHYNQHGLLLLQGKGIYRLANKWWAPYLRPYLFPLQ